MEFIIITKVIVQKNEDTWEQVTRCRTVGQSTTLKDIREWVNNIGAGWDAVQIHLNEDFNSK